MIGRNIVLQADEPIVGVGRPLKRIRIRVNDVIVPVDSVSVFTNFVLIQLQDAITSGDDVTAQYNPEFVRPVVNGIIAVDNAEELKAFTLTLAQIPVGQVEVDASMVALSFFVPFGVVIANASMGVIQHGAVLANISMGVKLAGVAEVSVDVSISAAQHGAVIVLNSSVSAAQNAAVQSIATIDLSQHGVTQITASLGAESLSGQVTVDVSIAVHLRAEVQIGASIGAKFGGEVILAMAVEVAQNGAVQVAASMGVDAGTVIVVDATDDIAQFFTRAGLVPLAPDAVVGEAPIHIAVLGDLETAWVLNRLGNSLTRLDLPSQTAVGTVDLLPDTSGTRIAVHPNQTEYWVTMENSGAAGSVQARRVSDDLLLATIVVPQGRKWGLAFTPDGLKAYVTNDEGPDEVYVIDALFRTLSLTLGVGDGIPVDPRGCAVSPDGSKVYVLGTVNRDIKIIQVSTDTVIGTITLPSFGGTSLPRTNVVFHPNGLFAYAGDQNADVVHEIDAVNDVVTGRTVNVGVSPRGIVISEDGKKLYVSSARVTGSTLHAIDTAAFTIDTTVVGFENIAELALGKR